MTRLTHRLMMTCAAVLTTVACSGTHEEAATDSSRQTAGPATAGTSGFSEMAAPDPGGKVIEVQLLTDEEGANRFDPREIEAHPGDVVRFTLKSGVHNVNFLPDSNRVKTGLPGASQLLQLPGQTVDLKVTMVPGKYYFQCDPHALLGMTGRLEVEKKD